MKLDELRGEWALVTGASSCIGREYCTPLGANGLNVTDSPGALSASKPKPKPKPKPGLRAKSHGRQCCGCRPGSAQIVVGLLVNSAAGLPRLLHTNVIALVELPCGFLPQLTYGSPS